jgi:hypothetical protein
MSWIISEIKDALDDLAPDLLLRGRGSATLRIHDEVENLAAPYAAASDLGFSDDYPEAAEGTPDRTLLVFRECRNGVRVFPSTQGEFLYDHCWMVFIMIWLLSKWKVLANRESVICVAVTSSWRSSLISQKTFCLINKIYSTEIFINSFWRVHH